MTQPEQSRSLGDKRQVVSVYPVKWAAIVEAGTRVGSARGRLKKSEDWDHFEQISLVS
jgi:hypothetical protein